MSKKKRTRFPWGGLGYGPVGFRKKRILGKIKYPMMLCV